MFGCIRKLGCLVLILVGVLAWFTRDRWLPLVRNRGADTVGRDGVWEPLTDAGAQRARTAVESLGRKGGPVFASVRPGDLASYVFVALAKQLPPSAENVQASVTGDRLYVKAVVSLSDFGGTKALGGLAAMLNQRDTVLFGGTFDLVRPGLAEYRVQELRFGQLGIPKGAIPRVIRQIQRGGRPEGVAEDGLPLEVPAYVGDVRVRTGRVTLYKNTP